MKRFFTNLKHFTITGLVLFSFTFNASAQSPGDIIITEVGPKKGGGCSDPYGEWWEIYNTTASDIDLTGWKIDEDGGGDDAIISAIDAVGGDVIIEAGTFYVFGSRQSCVSANYEYGPADCSGDCSNMSLSNCGDGVQIKAPDNTLISYFLYSGCVTSGLSFHANNIPEAIANGGQIDATNVNYGTGGGNTPSPGTASAGQILLPVELLSFSGNKKENYTHLTWQTATEINNEGFEVQRSQDSKTWETINFIAGHGNSNEVINYEYQDRQPLQGMNYYRLKQMDFDGAFTYSEVVSVSMESTVGAVSIYPNPVSDDFTLTMNIDKTTEGQIQILDYSGKTVWSQNIVLEDGLNQLPVTTNNLQKGIYFIQIAYANEVTKTMKFIKQ